MGDREKNIEPEIHEMRHLQVDDPKGDEGDTATPEEPAHEYATPRELSLLSTVFTIATFMIAIDGSILGNFTFCANFRQTC